MTARPPTSRVPCRISSRRRGGAFSEVTESLGEQGATAAERILDELILARVRLLTKSERVAFMAHVRDLVDSVDDDTVTVEVEDAVVVDAAPESEEAQGE